MNLLAPGYLLAAAAAGALVVALHFLARRQPPAAPLPTARFVPDRPARAPSRALRPADLLLLALRLGALGLAGLALARPSLAPPLGSMARVVLLDQSRAVLRLAEARDSATARLRAGDTLLVFDSAGTGSLAAALVRGLRAAAALEPRAESVELVLVSPLAREEWDGAVPGIRAMWPGPITLVRVPARAPSHRGGVVVRSPLTDDPVRAALDLEGATTGAAAGGPAAVRVVRDAVTSADSAFAAAGGVLVAWPATVAARDTSGAVVTAGAASGEELVVAAAFPRAAALAAARAPRRVVARWADGRVAAGEETSGSGCVRTVAVPVSAVGDLALRPGMRRLAVVLTAECGGPRDPAPLGDSLRALLGEAPRAAPAPPASAAAAFPALSGWLLALAALLLGAEQVLRRGGRTAESAA